MNEADELRVDFRELGVRYPFIMFVPQARFPEFITTEAARYPNFHLMLGAAVEELVTDAGPCAASAIVPPTACTRCVRR